MDNNKKAWISVGVIGALFLGLYAYNKRKAKPTQSNKGLSVKDAQDIEHTELFPIRLGSKGYEVKVVQRYLNTVCKSGVELSGVFDENLKDKLINCKIIGRDEIDEDFYFRIQKDLEAGKILP